MNAMNRPKIIAALLIAVFLSLESHAALGADNAGGMTKVRMGLAARSTTSRSQKVVARVANREVCFWRQIDCAPAPSGFRATS